MIFPLQEDHNKYLKSKTQSPVFLISSSALSLESQNELSLSPKRTGRFCVVIVLHERFAVGDGIVTRQYENISHASRKLAFIVGRLKAGWRVIG